MTRRINRAPSSYFALSGKRKLELQKPLSCYNNPIFIGIQIIARCEPGACKRDHDIPLACAVLRAFSRSGTKCLDTNRDLLLQLGSHGDTVEGESLSDESKGTDRRSPCL